MNKPALLNFLLRNQNQRCRIFVDARSLILYILSHLAPVAGKVNSVIRWINHYPLDSAIGFPNNYPMDSAIHRINHYIADKYYTVKSHVTVKALGLHNFIRSFGWAHKRRQGGGGGLKTGDGFNGGFYGIGETNCKMTIHWVGIYSVDSAIQPLNN